MQQNMKYELYKRMIEKLEKYNPQNWIDIDAILMLIRKPPESHQVSVANSFPKEIKNGIAFLTYDYGIDGVYRWQFLSTC